MNAFKIREVIEHFPECKFVGNGETELLSILSLNDIADKPMPHVIAWVSDKNLTQIHKNLSIGLLILSPDGYTQLKDRKCNFLITTKPRFAFLKLLSLKFSFKYAPAIEKTAVIHSSVKIGRDCYIGHHVVIEEGVQIGNKTEILHNTVIMKGTRIGNNVKIGCNNSIGNAGFGFEKDENGKYIFIEHIGGVVIEDEVEIRDNNTIIRGVLNDTILHKNAKIDTQIHIAHGVEIGNNTLVISHVQIGGSTKIGDNCWIAPSATLLNKITIGDNTTIGLGAVVIKSAEPNSNLVGNPAINLNRLKKPE